MSISLEQVTKHYDTAVAISDISVEIADGEFFVLLGPSGSGKSTLLRAVAGLTPIDRGRIVLHGRDVTHVSAREREVGLVFQNYALFKHMTVADNIEFALRARGASKARRRSRCRELLELVSLEGLGDRRPAELSGGQQQRVALARALAHEPRVLLLDEPFGALDARIREGLRRSVRAIQRAVGITAILVTHDQEEAFSLADRIGVMDRGRLQEVDEPRRLYTRPRTRFVATFLGAANLMLGRHEPEGVRLGRAVARVDGLHRHRVGGEATVVVRPEDIAIDGPAPRNSGVALGHGVVTEVEFIGLLERVRVALPSRPHLLSAIDPNSPQIMLEASRSARDAERAPISTGQRVPVAVKRIHVLPTPIGSLRVLAPTAEQGSQLAGSPLLIELGERMQVTPAVRVMNGELPAEVAGGLPVIELQPQRGLAACARLLEGGAGHVLGIRDSTRRIDRLLIHIQPTRAAREAGLAVAATLLRHLAVDATLLVASGNRYSLGGSSYRDLLDLRHSALRGHGVDVRTESFDGSLAEAVRARLSPRHATLLLLGLTSLSAGHELMDELDRTLSTTPLATALIVRGDAAAGAGNRVRPTPAETAEATVG